MAASELMQRDQIQVVGRLKRSSYTAKDGTEKQNVSISLNKINRIINDRAPQDYASQPVVQCGPPSR